jgi:hypothetical protein
MKCFVYTVRTVIVDTASQKSRAPITCLADSEYLSSESSCDRLNSLTGPVDLPFLSPAEQGLYLDHLLCFWPYSGVVLYLKKN